jgi:hypothetical protein
MAAALVTIAAAPAAAVTGGVPGTYVATTPTRVLDTRTGAYGNRDHRVGSHGGTTVKVTGSSGVPADAAAVVGTITVIGPTRKGGIVAGAYGGSRRPSVTNVSFVAGAAATAQAVVRIGSGRIRLWNVSNGSVHLVMDVTGYYVGGTPTKDGALHLRGARRVINTRTGLNGFHAGAVRAGETLSADLGALAGLPDDAGAVATMVTVLDPGRSGSLIAYATGTTRPTAPLLDFTARRSVTQYAVLPISDIQGLSLHNASAGSVQVTVDVIGYFTSGPAAIAHGQQVVTANRAFVDSTLPAHGADTFSVLGRGGVPNSGVAAVALAVRVHDAARGGSIVGGARQAPIAVSFSAGKRATGHAMLRLVKGRVELRNTSARSVALEVDVVGYVPSRTLTAPSAISLAHYPNDLTGNVTSDAAQMNLHGQQDASVGATFVLLDLGAQSIHAPLSATDPGIALTMTDPTVRIDYADLVTDIESYIDGLGTAQHVMLAVGTNNDGTWSTYGALARGRNFANQLIDPLVSYGSPRNVTVVGANDIESIFASTQDQAERWESAYFAATSADLIFNGALVGCPTVFGSTASCSFGWTQRDYVSLTRHVVSGHNRIQVLPQIYFPVQAVQWANIFARSGNGLRFLGSLTEHGSAPTTYLPKQGWTALVRALQWRVASPRVRRMVDIAPAA